MIQDIVREMYKIRSDIVHNGGHNAEKLAKKKLGGIKNASNIAKKMVKLLFLRILIVGEESIDLLTRDELTSRLNNLMIGEYADIPKNLFFINKMEEFFTELEKKA